MNIDNQELVRRIGEAQKENPTKEDFIELVKEDMFKIWEAFVEGYISHERNYVFIANIQRPRRGRPC